MSTIKVIPFVAAQSLPQPQYEAELVSNHDNSSGVYDDVEPESLDTPMGRVNPQRPLAGLEHIRVCDRDAAILAAAPPVHSGALEVLPWAEVREIVARMDLFRFRRHAHDLRNYLRWKYVTEQRYGRAGPGGQRVSGVLMYILEVLMAGRWGTRLPVYATAQNRALFEDVARDVCILANDFPYAVDPRIVHVVVWLRTPIPIEPVPEDDKGSDDNVFTGPAALAATTRLTARSRALIARYVAQTFEQGLGMAPERVLWFKNWAALQSIPAMEHFHVMLLAPPRDQLQAYYSTGGVQIDIHDL